MKKSLCAVGGLAFGGVVFVALPFRMLSQNTDDLGNAGDLQQMALLGLLIFLVGYAIVYLVLRQQSFERFSRILLIAGLFILFADILSPLSIGQLITGAEDPAEPIVGVLVEVVVLVLLIWLFRKPATESRYRVVWIFSLVFLGAETFAAYNAGLFSPGQRAAYAAAPAETQLSSSGQGNIYHFVFDGFHGPWLQNAMNDLENAPSFDGFVHFRNARSNYLMTRASVPSFLTGRLYDGTITLSQWLEETDDQSLLKSLGERGYTSTLYILNKLSGNRHADRQVVGSPVTNTYAADLWLLRLVPTIFRQEVFSDGRGAFSRMLAGGALGPTGDLRTVTSLDQYVTMLEDETVRASNGEYVFIHLNLPHAPYHLTRDLQYDPPRSDFDEQMILSVKLMGMLVEKLKQEGHFDNSLIIFQSDHGSWSGGAKQARNDPARNFLTIDDELAAEIAEIDARRNDGRKVDARSRALLLVKPPSTLADQRPLRVTDTLVQTADTPDLTRHLLDRDPASAGDVLAELEERFGRADVSIFHGAVLQIDDQGRELRVGKDINAGSLNHYKVFDNGQWAIADPVQFVW